MVARDFKSLDHSPTSHLFRPGGRTSGEAARALRAEKNKKSGGFAFQGLEVPGNVQAPSGRRSETDSPAPRHCRNGKVKLGFVLFDGHDLSGLEVFAEDRSAGFEDNEAVFVHGDVGGAGDGVDAVPVDDGDAAAGNAGMSHGA